jgi:hypothetical protein
MLRRSIALVAVCVMGLGVGQVMAADSAAKTKVVFVAGNPSHAPGDHEHRAGCMLLAKCLEEGLPQVDTEVTFYGWPKDEKIFDGAASVVMYCDGGDNHYVNSHLDFVQRLVDKGVGVVCLHYGVEVPKGPSGDKFLQWIGGYFEMNWSVNPHWNAEFKALPEHPITQGVKPFSIVDEWYYHMRFPEGMKNVTPILTAMPPEDTLDRPDGPHSGNPDVRKAIAAASRSTSHGPLSAPMAGAALASRAGISTGTGRTTPSESSC